MQWRYNVWSSHVGVNLKVSRMSNVTNLRLEQSFSSIKKYRITPASSLKSLHWINSYLSFNLTLFALLWSEVIKPECSLSLPINMGLFLVITSWWDCYECDADSKAAIKRRTEHSLYKSAFWMFLFLYPRKLYVPKCQLPSSD